MRRIGINITAFRRTCFAALVVCFCASFGVAEGGELDGIWRGTAEQTSCLGHSEIEFQVSGNSVTGTWTMSGGSMFPNKTEKLKAIIDGNGRISTSFGGDGYFLKIAGRLDASNAGGTIKNPIQDFCFSVWQARKIDVLPTAGGSDVEKFISAKADQPAPARKVAEDRPARLEYSQVEARIRHLRQLVAQGLISKEEADAMRQELLDQL